MKLKRPRFTLRTLFVVVTALAVLVYWGITAYTEANRGLYRRGLPNGVDISTSSDRELQTHLKWIESVIHKRKDKPRDERSDKIERDAAEIRAELMRRAESSRFPRSPITPSGTP
jgi:hypothetical protein